MKQDPVLNSRSMMPKGLKERDLNRECSNPLRYSIWSYEAKKIFSFVLIKRYAYNQIFKANSKAI